MKWEKVKLETVAEIIAGQSPESKYYNQSGNGLPFFQGKADFGYEFPKVRYWCTEPTKKAQPLDILLSVRAPVGPTNICNVESCIGRGLAAIRTGEKLNNKYLYWWFKSYENKLSSMGNGSTFSAITTKVVKDLEIPLPPLHIQEQIADTLDKADAHRRKDQELLQKYDQLAQAIFYDMFGDPVRNERGWESGSIEEYFELINGDRSENYPTTEDFVESGVPFFGTNDMKEIFLSEKVTRFLSEEKFNSLGRGKLKYDDLVITLRGSLGNICLFRSKKHNTGFINAQMMILRGKREVDHLFSTFVFQSKEYKRLFERITGGSAVPQITSKQVSKLPFIYPPVSKQREFSQALIKCINSKNNLTAFTEKSFFKTLIAKMF